MTFHKAEEEQEEMLEKINELEKRINPKRGSKPKGSNKKKMEDLKKKAEDVYNFRKQ